MDHSKYMKSTLLFLLKFEVNKCVQSQSNFWILVLSVIMLKLKFESISYHKDKFFIEYAHPTLSKMISRYEKW